MVGGLLLVAFVLFVFAQAAVIRSAGQSAADAAALAAVRESRDRLHDAFLEASEGKGDLAEVLEGSGYETPSACDEASRLADRNKANVTSCVAYPEGPGYTVTIETQGAVGQSVIPGTENEVARVTATAVLESMCEVAEEEDDHIELRCERDSWSFDPNDDELPEARDLFHIYLED